ncbi:hydrolase [Methanosarcina sp. 2.H.T.1A.6]|uniref:metal-dependent hydrolase family protein n=1 Tax=unclassified Methanosarcina TaxID=2644672 RepID=UPI0006225E3F|nr:MULTISPECIES: amidohydrolase family protein [unclassified Methanosarcina]KKG14158.1 hydrolase [Methanosarcina sp. 2.H.T.1A.3]KKG19648.1 hydrolase [Methanosarcina sp. 2.H.T.1A.6]KKG22151.1 hydrolase [Methanosarcina sp. 2.H.T.1A.15]KKG26799.1 hydrolase [Methanosarcina sp. 2.H.T.1A.8]
MSMQSDKPKVLITNANTFDGQHEALAEGMSVLVERNKIVKIAESISAPANATVIDAKGKVLMPGLIDAHWHSMFNFWPISKVLSSDFGLLSIAASKEARETLLRGFTTVRDAGGNCFPIKIAADEGLIDGPRVYPSGPYISQTAGHGDFRGPNDVPENPGTPLDYTQRVGHTLIADGVPEVTKRTREALRMGASQVKAMAGGGVTSLYDPLDVTEYTFDEMKAICDVAKTWNTYVMIHANTDEAIRQWIKAGAMSVEHGFFIEEETAKLMSQKGVWWCMQPMSVNDEDAFKFESPISTAKYEQCVSGLVRAITLAKKYNVKTAFGTDMLFDPALAAKQGKFLAKMKKWYTSYEALKMATYDNAQLLKMCGPRDPYPGELGVVKEGALADLILVDGNPLESLDLIANPEKNLALIMKDGKIYKNTVK